MKRIFERDLVLLFMLLFVPLAASATGNARTNKFDWNPVMDAIIQVESEGNLVYKRQPTCRER